MTENSLAKASRDLADTGACRAFLEFGVFLVSDAELPADQSRVDQENKVAECFAMAGLTADKGDCMAAAPNKARRFIS